MNTNRKHKLPPEWVDRIFQRLDEIYQGQWSLICKGKESEMKEMWASGLCDLGPEEIRKGIVYCRESLAQPPTIVQFHFACKGALPQKKRPVELTDEAREVGQKHIKHIMESLGMKK